jgi:hypothetical protein
MCYCKTNVGVARYLNKTLTNRWPPHSCFKQLIMTERFVCILSFKAAAYQFAVLCASNAERFSRWGISKMLMILRNGE